MRSRNSGILAHPGHWKNESGYKLLEKNSLKSISRTVRLGFGIVTPEDFEHFISLPVSRRVTNAL